MNGYRCATITPEEASNLMRDAGIRIEAETIRNGLEQGAFPFGVFIERNKRIFIISKKKFAEWVEDFTGVKIVFENDDAGEAVRS